jgi:hypothetical protein
MHSQNYKLTPALSENCFAIFLLRVRSNNIDKKSIGNDPGDGDKLCLFLSLYSVASSSGSVPTEVLKGNPLTAMATIKSRRTSGSGRIESGNGNYFQRHSSQQKKKDLIPVKKQKQKP